MWTPLLYHTYIKLQTIQKNRREKTEMKTFDQYEELEKVYMVVPIAIETMG